MSNESCRDEQEEEEGGGVGVDVRLLNARIQRLLMLVDPDDDEPLR